MKTDFTLPKTLLKKKKKKKLGAPIRTFSIAKVSHCYYDKLPAWSRKPIYPKFVPLTILRAQRDTSTTRLLTDWIVISKWRDEWKFWRNGALENLSAVSLCDNARHCLASTFLGLAPPEQSRFAIRKYFRSDSGGCSTKLPNVYFYLLSARIRVSLESWISFVKRFRPCGA